LAFTLLGAEWVLWLLIGLSVVSLGVIIERFWYLATRRVQVRGLLADMRILLESGPVAEGKTKDALVGAMEGAKAKERLRLERNLAYLATLGSNAPFIGLFGTVLGIIRAFHDLAGNQAGGVTAVLAGISEALVSTAVGLMVAIPAVVAFNYFNRRVRGKMNEVDWMAHVAMAQLSGSAKPPDADGTAQRSRSEVS
jgi:biopolymer transport protein ExbB